jgi:hypothetical protein
MGKKKKTLEQRLLEAYRIGCGVILSADEVASLIHDEAIATRICNTAAAEHGNPIQGSQMCGFTKMTWTELGKAHADT